MIPPYLRAHEQGVVLAVKVQPRASRNEIGEALGAELKVKVTAAPVDDAANEALVKLLAEAVGCPRGAVRLIKGHTSRHKTILLAGLSVPNVAAKLHPETS